MRLQKSQLSYLDELVNSLDNNQVRISKKQIAIPKIRTLYIPNDYANEKQRDLLKTLSKISLPNNIFSKLGMCYIDKAKYHLKQDYLVNFDIKDFFPTIHYMRIKKLYIGLGISPTTADKLSFLTTFNNQLPQGFVTSPILSNLVFYGIDQDLNRYLFYKKVKYSRYADDLTFSSNKPISKIVLNRIAAIINSKGFKFNNDKTIFYGKNDRKIVMKLILNENDINVTKEYISKVDENIALYNEYKKNNLDNELLLKQLQGELSFIKQVNSTTYKRLKGKLNIHN